jgi:hypothetical protein
MEPLASDTARLEHLLGDGEVGDDSVFHGANGLDVAGHAPQHLFRFVADRLNDFFAAGATFVTNGYDRRLIEHNTLATNINEGIGGTKVDRHIGGEITAEKSEHGRSVM